MRGGHPGLKKDTLAKDLPSELVQIVNTHEIRELFSNTTDSVYRMFRQKLMI